MRAPIAPSFDISRRFALLSLIAAALGLASLVPTVRGAEEGAGPRRPNVVFVLTDDQRWDQLGCAGHPHLKTPRIDRLAAEGVRFSHAFVTTSLCSPSRASYLSGMYAHSHGVVNNFTDYPRDFVSFPQRLKEQGYTTAYIGKWHMGEDDDSPRPGYDHWISHRGQGNYFDNEFNVDGERKSFPGYYTTVVTDLAVDYLEKRSGDEPFCLIVGHKAPHTPFTPEPKHAAAFDGVPVDYPHTAYHLDGKPDWIRQRLDTWHGIYGPIYGFRETFPDRSAPAVLDFERFVHSYWGTILSVDESVGRIYDALQKQGRLDDTIFVFAGDNGMFLGEHGMTDKRSMHEESIRVPLLVRYPRALPGGEVCDELVLNVDLAPSLLELCDAPPLEKIHGKSFVAVAKGEATGLRDSFLYEYNYEKQFPYTPNVRGVRTKRFKYMHYPHGDGSPDRHLAELYDLVADPQERTNLIDDPRFADVKARLMHELDRQLAATGALPDQMPIDEGIGTELPDAKIR